MGMVGPAQYVVTKILGIAIDQNNKKLYKVQWAPTWVEENKLVGCQHLIQAFLAEQQEQHQQEQKNNQIVPLKNELLEKQAVLQFGVETQINIQPQEGVVHDNASSVDEQESWFDMMDESGEGEISKPVSTPKKQTDLRHAVNIEEKTKKCHEDTETVDACPASDSRAIAKPISTQLSTPKKQVNLRHSAKIGKTTKTLNIESGLFKCDKCRKLLDTFSSFQHHLKNKCIDRSPYQFRRDARLTPNEFHCVSCVKKFKSSPLLRKHIKTHTGIMECNQCGLRFRRYHKLNHHIMNVHMDEDLGHSQSQTEAVIEDVEENRVDNMSPD